MAERQIPGLSVAVAIDGRLVWSEGFGYADREKRLLACPQTQFRIASLSKLLTAAAMAQLYEQGRLDLDAPIQRYVPSFPDKGYPITARQLASHRSGIRGYRDDGEAINTMTARDLHLRRVCFHFGASSGGTAVLAIYPEQRMSFAVLTNLGHAKLPFARLMRVINPFLPDPALPISIAVALFLAGARFLAAARRCRQAGPVAALPHH